MDVFKGLSLVALTGSGGMLETEWVPYRPEFAYLYIHKYMSHRSVVLLRHIQDNQHGLYRF